MSALEVVTAYLDAHNVHDVARALALLSDDFRFEAVGLWTRRGKRLARQLEEWDAAINSALLARDLAGAGDRVTCTVTERNDWFRLAGIEALHYQPCDFGLQAGKIASVTAAMTSESARTVGQALQAIISWASQHRGQALRQLMPGGEFIYSAESAARWLDLLREWRASG